LPSPHGTETILLVEDEPVVRAMASSMLRAQGYTILEASNGTEALTVAGSHPEQIHILVTDVVMPHMNGRMLAEHIQKITPEIKILFTSGYLDDTILHHRVLESAAFLQKPYTLVSLARKIREILDSDAEASQADRQ